MRQQSLFWFFSSLLVMSSSVFMVCSNSSAEPYEVTIIDAAKAVRPLAKVISELAGKRVIFVGEQHDRYDHHLSQLAIIRQLHEQHSDWVIGLEFFQQPFQKHLDDYINGIINEHEFLLKTEYFERWGYDYRLYREIFNYAREQQIPLLALNIAQEISSKVAQTGIANLEPDERNQIPLEIDKSDEDYRLRLQEIFQQHPGAESKNFDNFWETQLVWDESMAQRAADYLQDHPDKSMIVLAGTGHIAHGSGIPNRLQRRLPVATAILLPTDDAAEVAANDADYQGADYLFSSQNIELPAGGKMGVMLDLQQGVSAKDVLPGSAAETAGMRNNDQILSVDGQPIKSFTDVRWIFLDKTPGDEVTVTVQRDDGSEQRKLSLKITLQE